jgi:hypothetical protein
LIWVTANEGGDWKNVTPADLTAWSKVTQIEASHFDPKVAYASVSRFRLDDLKPHLYRTRDGGQSWQPITTGLSADAPVNAVREDPACRGLLFAATEKAVWVSFDDGEHWQSLQLNLPHTSMRDLALHDQDLIVATHGRAFWILDDIGPLRAFAGNAAHRESTLLKPSPAVRVRRSTGTDTPIPPDEPTGHNPPDGAVIDYYFPQAVKGAVALEVLDSRGTVVRRVASTDTVGFSEEERARELIPAYWIRQPKPLSTAVGMHRFIWDLRYTAPRTAKRSFPISAVPADTPQEPSGPIAIPGVYRVRLQVGARTWEAPLTVMPDPRVTIAQQDYAAQFALAEGLAHVLDASTVKLLQAGNLRKQLKALETAHAEPIATLAKGLDGKLAILLDSSLSAQDSGARPGLSRVNSDIASLYQQVVAADAAPTQAQSAAAESLLKEWQSIDAPSAKNWQADLAALNEALSKARLPILRSDVLAADEGDSNDEE